MNEELKVITKQKRITNDKKITQRKTHACKQVKLNMKEEIKRAFPGIRNKRCGRKVMKEIFRVFQDTKTFIEV